MAAQRYDHILMCEGLTQRESDALPAIFVKVDLARVPSLGALAILLDLEGQAISPLAFELRCAPAAAFAACPAQWRQSEPVGRRQSAVANRPACGQTVVWGWWCMGLR